MDHVTGEPSVPSDFELAAQVCGHDTTTWIGAENARHDHHVYDLLDAWAIQEHIANARHAIDNSTAVRP